VKKKISDYAGVGKFAEITDIILPERGAFFRAVEALPHFSAG
jgi:hypothetical protein